MINNKRIFLLFVVLFIVLESACQKFPVTLGDSNSLIFGRIYSLTENDIIVLGNTHNYTDSISYTKFYHLSEEALISNEKKLDFIIDDILIYNEDSIYFIYTTLNSIGEKYLFAELVNAEYKQLSKDSLRLTNVESERSEIFLSNGKIHFYCVNYTISENIYNITLGTINKNGEFNYNVKTIETFTPYLEDVLVTPQNEWIFFYWQYFVKMDSNFNIILEKVLTSENDMDKGYDSFCLSDNYFITGGNVGSNLCIMKSYCNNMVRRKQVLLEKSNTIDRASGFDNIAKADSFFYFLGTVGIDTSDINYNPDSQNRYIYVACFDFELNEIWKKKFGGDRSYGTHSICVTKENGCAVLASYSPSIYSRGVKLYLLELNKWGDILTSAPIVKEKNGIIIYPNPGTNQFNIKLPEYSQPVSLNLYNISGVKVLSEIINSQQTQIPASHLPKGIYIYQFSNGLKVIDSGKWVKQ